MIFSQEFNESVVKEGDSMKQIFCAHCNKRIRTLRSSKSRSSPIIKSYALSFCSLSCRSKYYDELSNVDKNKVKE